jgi:hypothetical protein
LARRSSTEFSALHFRQGNRAAHEHDYTPVLVVTVH